MKRSWVLLLFLGLVLLLVSGKAWMRRAHMAGPLQPTKTSLSVVVAGAAANSTASAQRSKEERKTRRADGPEPEVSHLPQMPKSGDTVRIAANLKPLKLPLGELHLEYQIVDPGRYIAKSDRSFEKNWTKLPMNDRGEAGDSTPQDGIYGTELPAEIQKHRRLVRYRIRSASSGALVAPEEDDSQGNYAYFVYDGVPPWKGAIHPKGSARLRQPVTFSSDALQRVPVYHFISSKSSVEKATWFEPAHFGEGNRQEYRHTGTMVYDGKVYDHVGFRARGGGWRHAMGKNMWKFNFLRGHRFEARDHYGKRYNCKWDKLNLGACIQQADYGMRGEQGMFEAVGFRLFNLAGLEASRTHWVHLRIIDEAEESPDDQYSGDFWGLYLAVENLDEHFIKEHNLPEGNLYKMEFGAKTAHNGIPTITNQEDVNEFMRASMRRQQPNAWWLENLDLPRYYNYRAILECIHHYDIDSGKNYFYFHNPETGKWAVFPWDIDLSWGDHMYGGGQEPFYRAGVISRNPFKHQYQDRLAEIRDLLFNPEQIGLLIDEHAAMISDPKGAPSLADADRAKWDYHPILESRHVMSMKAGQGKFYFGDPRNNFRSMVTYMKNYATKRAKWIDARLLSDFRPPTAPQIAPPDGAELAAADLAFQLASAGGEPRNAYRWRLAEVTQPESPVFNPTQPWKYEIEPLWEKEGPEAQVSIPVNLLVPGHTYRIRARGQDSSGAWSRWSSPVQFTVRTP